MDSAFLDSPSIANFAQQRIEVEQHDLRWRILACLRVRIPEIRETYVTVVGNTAVVRGQVASHQEKRAYLECCRHVPGVTRLVDELVVVDHVAGYQSAAEDLY